MLTARGVGRMFRVVFEILLSAVIVYSVYLLLYRLLHSTNRGS